MFPASQRTQLYTDRPSGSVFIHHQRLDVRDVTNMLKIILSFQMDAPYLVNIHLGITISHLNNVKTIDNSYVKCEHST